MNNCPHVFGRPHGPNDSRKWVQELWGLLVGSEHCLGLCQVLGDRSCQWPIAQETRLCLCAGRLGHFGFALGCNLKREKRKGEQRNWCEEGSKILKAKMSWILCSLCDGSGLAGFDDIGELRRSYCMVLCGLSCALCSETFILKPQFHSLAKSDTF